MAWPEVQPEFWHWLVAGLIFVSIEPFVPGTFFLWMGISAGIVGLISWALPALGFEAQVLAFALLSIATILISRRYLKRHPIVSDAPLLNRRAEQYVGRVFTLQDPLVNGRGRLRVDDTVWRVEGEDCPAGTAVEVTGVDGTLLRVRPQAGRDVGLPGTTS
ncbi:MAG: NfeD family protein [Gammaproteobacteria bacterium]|nr:NfeD family protein [Gammaproteobacteria bacterium]